RHLLEVGHGDADDACEELHGGLLGGHEARQEELAHALGGEVAAEGPVEGGGADRDDARDRERVPDAQAPELVDLACDRHLWGVVEDGAVADGGVALVGHGFPPWALCNRSCVVLMPGVSGMRTCRPGQSKGRMLRWFSPSTQTSTICR